MGKGLAAEVFQGGVGGGQHGKATIVGWVATSGYVCAGRGVLVGALGVLVVAAGAGRRGLGWFRRESVIVSVARGAVMQRGARVRLLPGGLRRRAGCGVMVGARVCGALALCASTSEGRLRGVFGMAMSPVIGGGSLGTRV